MTVLRVYLTAYFVLLLAAAVTLWRSRVLAEVPGLYLLAAATVAVGLGVLLAATSRRRPTQRE